MKPLLSDTIEQILERAMGLPDDTLVELHGRQVRLGMLRDVEAILRHEGRARARSAT